MGVLGAVPVAEIRARGSIERADVIELRRNTREGDRITADEAQILLALNAGCPLQDPAWPGWFVETLTDFIVDGAAPAGRLTSDDADWLIARIARNGRIESRTAMELVLAVLDGASWVPPRLVRFALDQVRDTVVDGAGPLRSGDPCVPRTVGEAHVVLVRRILCSFDGDGNLPVTLPEAEVLLDIDAATAGSANHPSWRDLFVKAMANAALAACGYSSPPRSLALARIEAIAARVNGGSRLSPNPAYRMQTGAERDIARLARQRIEIVTREPLVLADADWLADRIAGCGRPSPNARCLLLVLKGAGAALDAGLQALVDKVAAAL
jgi:hypothetical protein